MEKERKQRVFAPGQQIQSTSNREGLTRTEIYECVSYNNENGLVEVVNDNNKLKSYSSLCFRTIHDDFAKMFGIE